MYKISTNDGNTKIMLVHVIAYVSIYVYRLIWVNTGEIQYATTQWYIRYIRYRYDSIEKRTQVRDNTRQT